MHHLIYYRSLFYVWKGHLSIMIFNSQSSLFHSLVSCRHRFVTLFIYLVFKSFSDMMNIIILDVVFMHGRFSSVTVIFAISRTGFASISWNPVCISTSVLSTQRWTSSFPSTVFLFPVCNTHHSSSFDLIC